MADCNDLFQKFLSEINIKPDCSKNLQRGREAIKREIENYFSNKLKVGKPDFYLQGSYSLKTMIEPLNPKDEYDLDDGIYLKHTDDDISKPTTEEVSNWIFKAVEGHTKKNPENKKNCVRVIYTEGYHIDLAIYRKIKGKYYLARLGKDQWVPSDARAFNNWFYERLERNEQMRSCIKYLKAWKDFNSCDIKGIHLTVLVGLNYVSVTDRDDKSLVETVGKIINYLEQKKAILNPVDQNENMIANWSEEKIRRIISAFKEFSSEAGEALDEQDKDKASKIWRALFGDRFPLEDSNNRGKVVNGPKHREIIGTPKSWGEC